VLDCRGKVLQVNPALVRMFQLDDGDPRGRTHTEVIRHEQLEALIRAVLERRHNRSGEMTLATGRTLRVEISIAGGARENEACAVCVFHDLTIYPNPFSQAVNIIVNGKTERALIEVFDVNGSIAYRNENYVTNEKISFGENFEAGFYVIRVTSSAGVKSLKLIKTQ
ncbi:MAG TPA: T9SS type A sorting domain-containing protein, partial [Bacteroidia bacterium]|nr:T9SS type A sorting domain-containing protein [Bacteroidia bacterium]